jgi:hypothetical protein
VLLAVDSRATGGMYIGSGSVKKIIEINKVRTSRDTEYCNYARKKNSFRFFIWYTTHVI